MFQYVVFNVYAQFHTIFSALFEFNGFAFFISFRCILWIYLLCRFKFTMTSTLACSAGYKTTAGNAVSCDPYPTMTTQPNLLLTECKQTSQTETDHLWVSDSHSHTVANMFTAERTAHTRQSAGRKLSKYHEKFVSILGIQLRKWELHKSGRMMLTINLSHFGITSKTCRLLLINILLWIFWFVFFACKTNVLNDKNEFSFLFLFLPFHCILLSVWSPSRERTIDDHPWPRKWPVYVCGIA